MNTETKQLNLFVPKWDRHLRYVVAMHDGSKKYYASEEMRTVALMKLEDEERLHQVHEQYTTTLANLKQRWDYKYGA